MLKTIPDSRRASERIARETEAAEVTHCSVCVCPDEDRPFLTALYRAVYPGSTNLDLAADLADADVSC